VADDILLTKGEPQVFLRAKYANRHGMVSGATGTGKTVSLMVVAEGLSRSGVPVFIADVKGDVSGLAMSGAGDASPVIFWDLEGAAGHPIRATVSEIGPSLLARMFELNDVQAGVLDIAFRLADEQGLLLLDLGDLRALLNLVSDKHAEVSPRYGLVSAQSVAAIQRALLRLDGEGGKQFFGEPALELADLMRTDLTGRGIVNILAAHRLVLKPRLYSTFLLWLLSELFEQLPEVGDLDKPKLAFVFDEAHLLFDDAPPALMQRIEQVVRLIRSKGVGVYFCSQFPDDVPGEILGQLGNRIQHALRAFTPRDQKAVKTAAETFVRNPKIDVAEAIAQLGVGEALVSTLQAGGVPMPVERAHIATPRCRIGTITPDERAAVIARSPIGAKYDETVNRESAYEILAQRRKEVATDPSRRGGPAHVPEEKKDVMHDWLWGTGRRQGMVEAMAKQAARTVGSQLGRQILRGVLGGIVSTRSRSRS
jgi:DNA helicase HerA-like ATPase